MHFDRARARTARQIKCGPVVPKKKKHDMHFLKPLLQNWWYGTYPRPLLEVAILSSIDLRLWWLAFASFAMTTRQAKAITSTKAMKKPLTNLLLPNSFSKISGTM
jgi:hypothetical protein